MNPMHQLTRRPVKAAFGALLLALAGIILALSGGQLWAAARTRAGVEATYTTVAVFTGRFSSDEVLTPSAEGGSNAESLRKESAMAAAMEEINARLAAPGSGLSQANYYAGTALLAWTVKGGAVTFGTDTQPGGNGGNGGSSSSAALGGYIWPVSSRKINSPFGPRNTGIAGASTNHKGVDIGGVYYSSQVHAAKAGTVIISQYSSSYGNYVVIDHGNGNSTLYAHMSSRSVSEGQMISQGQEVGKVGSTGSSTGNHLHLEIRENYTRIDPESKFTSLTFDRAYNR